MTELIVMIFFFIANVFFAIVTYRDDKFEITIINSFAAGMCFMGIIYELVKLVV